MYSDSIPYRRLLKEIQCRRYLSKWWGPHLRNEFSTCAHDDDDDDDDAGDYACPVKYNKRWNTILSVVFDQTKTKFWHCPLARRRRERTKSKREIKPGRVWDTTKPTELTNEPQNPQTLCEYIMFSYLDPTCHSPQSTEDLDWIGVYRLVHVHVRTRVIALWGWGGGAGAGIDRY